MSKYDISDAFINFFRDASVNRKTVTPQIDAKEAEMRKERKENNGKSAACSDSPVFCFGEEKSCNGKTHRLVIIAAAVILVGFCVFMILGGYNRIRASRMCKEGTVYLSIGLCAGINIFSGSYRHISESGGCVYRSVKCVHRTGRLSIGFSSIGDGQAVFI